MTPDIQIAPSPSVQYVLRWADACLILAQRLSEWCGHAPVLEEDIALTNFSLDLVGQARGLLTHAGRLAAVPGEAPLDEDQLAFLRTERDYLNPTLVELPNGLDGRLGARDFAFTVLRNAAVAIWLREAWDALQASSDPELSAIAAKALKEARYHVQHASDWVVRLGDGTEESARRMQRALDGMALYLPELFEDDGVDEAAHEAALGPRASDLKPGFDAHWQALLAQARLQSPAACAFRSSGRRGVHSEHMGYLLAEMQSLQRSFPGGRW